MSVENEKVLVAIPDDEMAVYAKTDMEALTRLISRYLGIISFKAKKFSNDSNDVADLSQEGLMGLLDAVKAYDAEGDASFKTFANVCIRNRMLNALDSTGTHLSLDEMWESEESASGTSESPESIVFQSINAEELFQKVSSELSMKEWKVLQLYLTGSSYSQIVKELNLTHKVVDNAMQRVRRKLKSVLKTDNNQSELQ